MTSQDPDDNRKDAAPHDAGLPEYTDVTADAARSAGGPAPPGGRQPRIEGYRVLREISEGGQAVVYQAVQESTGRRVAVKVMARGAFATDQETERFEREVQILAALEHPNIVQIIDRGVTADGGAYFVMEYVEGQSLEEFLNAYHRRCEGVPDDPSELLRLFMEICDAVNAAHLRGVVHRDLKPTNIRVDTQGRPRVLDFGLARAPLGIRSDDRDSRPVTVTGQFLGSLPYASPEQAEGTPSMIDTRTDVYALGVILYRMLTNQYPYEVIGNLRDVLDNIMRAEPTPPSAVIEARLAKQANRQRRWRKEHRNPINPIVEAIVLKALAKRRQDRYESAGAFSRDVANYLSGKPTVAAGTVTRRRGPKIAAGVAAAVLCLAAAGAILWHLTRRPKPSAPPAGRTQGGRASRPAARWQVYAKWPFDAAEAGRRQTETARALGAEVAEEIDLGDGVAMKLVLLPAGTFTMGSKFSPEEVARRYGGTADRFVAEHPRREVTLTQPFYMGTHEVTRGQFGAFVGATAYKTEAETAGWAQVWTGGDWRKVKGASWRKAGIEQTDSHPVFVVSGRDAAAFCKWLTDRTGRRVALPTEAQWEYACRAGTATAFPWGDDPKGGEGWCNPADRTANAESRRWPVFHWSDGHRFTAPVGRRKLNAFGLSDMHGNVWEWCADYYNPKQYAAGGKTVDPTGPAQGGSLVIRGGSWNDDPRDCRSARRQARPGQHRADDIGFRVVVAVGGRRDAE